MPKYSKRNTKRIPRPVTRKNPCWKGYKMVGMKRGRNGKSVPNCVPKKK